LKNLTKSKKAAPMAFGAGFLFILSAVQFSNLSLTFLGYRLNQLILSGPVDCHPPIRSPAKKQFVNLLQTFFELFYILRLDYRKNADNLSPSRRKIGKSATHPAKGEVMYYQPRVIDKDGKLKAGIAAIEAATGLKKSVIVAKLIREGLKKATKATPELKDILEKED
jgi:hypothetical protein